MKSRNSCALPAVDAEKYCLNFKLCVAYKFCVVLTLLGTICALAISGLKFSNGEYSDTLLATHKILGSVLALAALLHVAINFKKLVKLTSEFASVALRSAQQSFCNMDRLIASLGDRSIKQIAAELNLDANALLNRLKYNGVNLKNKD